MSWAQLIAIKAEAKALADDERARPPLDCPNCATALREGPAGVRYCPWGDWREDG